MNDPVIFDSDILIEVLRDRNREVLDRWNELISGGGMLAYSAVTATEIWHGARDSESETIRGLFSVLTCIPVNGEIGRRAGEYLRRFRASHGMELGDAFIAATASVHELRLWTRNRKHYPMRDVQFY